MRTVDSRDAITDQSARMMTMFQVHTMIRDDIAQWTPRNFRPRESFDQPTTFVGGDVLERGHLFSFVRDGWTNPGLIEPRSGMTVVRYLIEDDRLIRRVRLATHATFGTEEVETVLLDNIDEFDVQFRGRANWVPQWQLATERFDSAPYAIELTIKRTDGREYAWKFLVPGVAL